MNKNQLGSGSNLDKAARSVGQIEHEIDCNTSAIDELGSALNRLEDRLHKGLRLSSLQVASDCDKEDEYLVPHADSLRMNRRRIDSLREQVESLLQRLEL